MEQDPLTHTQPAIDGPPAEQAPAGNDVPPDYPHEVGALTVNLLDRVTSLAENGAPSVSGVPTGFEDIDRATAGMDAGELVVVAGRSGVGKTSFALSVAVHASLTEGSPVMIFSMKLAAAKVTERVVGGFSAIVNAHLRTGRLDNDEWGRLVSATEQITPLPLLVDDTPSLSFSELRKRAHRQSQRCGRLGLIVVDCVQLMTGRQADQAPEICDISRGLKVLARELGCPVMALSQFDPNAAWVRKDMRPRLADLGAYRCLEHDADLVFLLHREEMYQPKASNENIAEVTIAKHRHGPVGTCRLAFLKDCMRFENLS